MNLDFYQMAVHIVGTNVPLQYEFIYAIVCLLLIFICIITLISPIILFIKFGSKV